MAKVYGICGDSKCRREVLSKEAILDLYSMLMGYSSTNELYEYKSTAYCGPQHGSTACVLSENLNGIITDGSEIMAAYYNGVRLPLNSNSKITTTGTYTEVTLVWDSTGPTMSAGNTYDVVVLFKI